MRSGITELTVGHLYELPFYEDKAKSLSIQFIEKANGEGDTLTTVNDGITSEQLLEVVEARQKHFCGHSCNCPENDEALFHIQEALRLLEKRVKDRIVRGVYGTQNA